MIGSGIASSCALLLAAFSTESARACAPQVLPDVGSVCNDGSALACCRPSISTVDFAKCMMGCDFWDRENTEWIKGEAQEEPVCRFLNCFGGSDGSFQSFACSTCDGNPPPGTSDVVDALGKVEGEAAEALGITPELVEAAAVCCPDGGNAFSSEFHECFSQIEPGLRLPGADIVEGATESPPGDCPEGQCLDPNGVCGYVVNCDLDPCAEPKYDCSDG